MSNPFSAKPGSQPPAKKQPPTQTASPTSPQRTAPAPATEEKPKAEHHLAAPRTSVRRVVQKAREEAEKAPKEGKPQIAVEQKTAPNPEPLEEPPTAVEKTKPAQPKSESKSIEKKQELVEKEKAVEPKENKDESVTPGLSLEETSCRTCRFFESRGKDRGAVTTGECRRMAPVPGNRDQAKWPEVGWDSWCGEWGQGISQEDMMRLAKAVADEVGEPLGDGVEI